MLCLAMLFTACQHHSAAKPNLDVMLQDDLFNPVIEIIETPEQIFALSQQTKAELQQLLHTGQSIQVKTDVLLNYLFAKKGSSLLYQNDATLTAEETLIAKQANCLSLTILSYSLAQELGLQAEFRDIQIPEYWTQSNNQSLLNGHVNLKIVGGFSPRLNGNVSYTTFNYVIDFDIENNKSHFPFRQLKKSQIVALFYNNKAAQALVYGQDNLAYAYLKAAVTLEPLTADSWNNLAVLYRKHMQYDLAENAYLLAIQLEPQALNAKGNLALLYQATGQNEKAEQLIRIVGAQRSQNPYYHIMLGHEALVAGQADNAILHYKRGLALDKKSSEAMFGLAKAHMALGLKDKAQHYLQLAERSAPNPEDKKRYQSKLKLLTTASVHHKKVH